MRSLSLLGLLSLLAACRAPEALVSAGEHPPIRTNQSEYVITRSERLLETRLVLTYVNRTGTPVFIHSCGGAEPPLLEKRVGGQWVVALVPVIDLCLGPPITVAPGATYPYEYRLTAGVPGTSAAPQYGACTVRPRQAPLRHGCCRFVSVYPMNSGSWNGREPWLRRERDSRLPGCADANIWT